MVVDVGRGVDVADHELVDIGAGSLESLSLVHPDAREQCMGGNGYADLALGLSARPNDPVFGRRNHAVMRSDLTDDAGPDVRACETPGEVRDQQPDDIGFGHVRQPWRME